MSLSASQYLHNIYFMILTNLWSYLGFLQNFISFLHNFYTECIKHTKPEYTIINIFVKTSLSPEAS